MSPNQRTSATRNRPRRLTSPSPFPQPYRRMPTRQLPPRPVTSPAGLPSGRVQARRAPWLRIDTSVSVSTMMTARSTTPDAEPKSEGGEGEQHGFVVSPCTHPLDSPLSDCSEVSNPFSPFSPAPYDPPIFRHCPYLYAHVRQQHTSHRRSISDNALPSSLVKAHANPKCLYPLDWTPQPLPGRIARPKRQPPTRDALFAPPKSPYPLALAGINVVAGPWTGGGSSSSSSPSSVRSNGSNGSGSPIDWSPFLATQSTTAMVEKHEEEAPSLGKGLGDIVKTCGRETSLPWGLRVPSSSSSSSSTPLPRSMHGREGLRGDRGLMPLRAAPPPPPFPSRVRLTTPPGTTTEPPYPLSLHAREKEHSTPQTPSSSPSLLTQILNARAWTVATSRVFGPTDPRTVAARKEESARRVERANWVERIEVSLGRTKGLREWWGARGQGGSGGNAAADGKQVRFAEQHGTEADGLNEKEEIR
ncbi:hypothetical protein HDK90DRAFT_463966 [Phyllosticta capitalensis]|uniref:Uncharacterized protein n=1 Tax=Phyllosticta capitalensis TaxID=121624 RepID=A0ABR1YVY4_9PEZI